MPLLKNSILLLKAEKSEKAQDKYEVMLSNFGFEAKYLKTLEFAFIQLDVLGEKLLSPHLYDGLIFTTPRSVQAVTKSGLPESALVDWQKKRNYVVGETTHELALMELGLNCAGSESGNAKNLAEVIISGQTANGKPLLFPCGNLVTETLIKKLKEENIQVDALTVYETRANSNLEEDFRKLTCNFDQIPEYFVYFSPSGVAETSECLRRVEGLGIKFVAIGPTTADALRKANIPVYAVCAKPTPADLVETLRS